MNLNEINASTSYCNLLCLKNGLRAGLKKREFIGNQIKAGLIRVSLGHFSQNVGTRT